MNIQQAKEEIKHTVAAYLKKDESGVYRIPTIRQRPILLMGPPGIGKTQIMEQVARECQIGLVAYTITHHTRQSAVGLPMIKEEEFNGKTYSVTEYTMSEIIASVYARIRDYGQKEGILFIDEINCVSETLTPAMLQFLQCKTFGNQAIPEGWVIVAAGNPPEYNKSVRDFDMVTLDRVRYINIEADLDVWKTYASAQHVHGAILSYLELRPKNFYQIEETVDGLEFVTARGWEDLSTLMKIYEEMDIPITEEQVRQFIRSEEVAEDVNAYLELYRKYQDDYRIGSILEGDVPSEIYARLMDAGFDERLSVVNLLLDGLGQYFQQVYNEREITNQWFEILKEYKVQLEKLEQCETTAVHGKVQEDANIIYNNLVTDVENALDLRIKSGYVVPEDAACQRKLLKLLKENSPELVMESSVQNEKSNSMDYFEAAKTGFMTQVKAIKELKMQTSQKLEHAFDFMEGAFTSGQEMLVFVTGLTMSKESAVFLADNLCERYLQYNEELLAGTKKAEILKKLEH